MIDHTTVKLGVKAIKTDSRTLKAGRYMKALPPAPPSKDWTNGIGEWGMMLNGPGRDNPSYAKDGLGDCTIAAIGHAIQIWSLNASGVEHTMSDYFIQLYYEKWDGYIPGNPSTDNGGIELDVLKNWQKGTFHGEPLMAFASVNVNNLAEVQQAISLFGGVYIGLNLPVSAQNQSVWDVVADNGQGNTVPGSWGGHCTFVPKYDPEKFTNITWGEMQPMTTAFWNTYVTEAYALLSPVFINSTGAPSGFDLAALQADLAQIV
jgi:hypothetical protein